MGRCNLFLFKFFFRYAFGPVPPALLSHQGLRSALLNLGRQCSDLVNVKEDGKCLFRALACGLPGSDGTDQKWPVLLHALFEYHYCTNPDMFVNYQLGSDDLLRRSDSEAKKKKPKGHKRPQGKFSYLEGFLFPSGHAGMRWAGAPELEALSNALNLTITVLSVFQEHGKYVEGKPIIFNFVPGGASAGEVVLVYNGLSHFLFSPPPSLPPSGPGAPSPSPPPPHRLVTSTFFFLFLNLLNFVFPLVLTHSSTAHKVSISIHYYT